MKRATYKQMLFRFESWLNSMGFEKAVFDQVTKFNVGGMHLDYAPEYGGYEIRQVVSKGGGEISVNGIRMNSKELQIWFTASRWTKDYQDKQLAHYRSALSER